MGLRDQLMEDLKDAMRQQDELRKRAIRSVLAAITIKQAEAELDADGQRASLGDADIVAVIAKQANQRRESILEYERAGRQDLVADEQAELVVLEAYLPQQLTRDEIESQARQVIATVGAAGPQDIGKVMKPLMVELRGHADGKLVNQVVRELLAG